MDWEWSGNYNLKQKIWMIWVPTMFCERAVVTAGNTYHSEHGRSVSSP